MSYALTPEPQFALVRGNAPHTTNWLPLNLDYKGPEIPCLRIIKKCSSMKTAISQGSTNV